MPADMPSTASWIFPSPEVKIRGMQCALVVQTMLQSLKAHVRRLIALGALLPVLYAGCANELMKTDVVRPIETKLTYYKTVEVPLPETAKGVPQIAGDFQQRAIIELGTISNFKRVRPLGDGDDDTLVIQAMIRKWDEGNAFLRWWGSVLDFGSNVYEQYSKQQLGMISGSIGDGYLLVDVKFLDKQSKEVLGQITVRGLSDDFDNPRSAEDRVIHSIVKYLQSRL